VRLLRFKERGGGPAHGEKQFGRDAETRGMAGLGDNGFPGRFQVLRMSCNEPRGAGEPVRARPASCATPQP
jgi:hypothetical protein